MVEIGFAIIISVFLIYYLFVLIFERKIIDNPKDILDKFLSILLLYAGISIIYYSLTGRPFLTDSDEGYKVYLFIIGFIAVLWTIPNLLKEFEFFNNFVKKAKKKK